MNNLERKIRKAYKERARLSKENKSKEAWDHWENAIKDLDRDTLMAIIKPILDAERRLQEYYNGYHYRTKIRKYAYRRYHTDCTPFEVVKVISDKTVEVREMDTTQIKFPQEFYAGGFAGHFADNHNQEYEYKSNTDNPVIRIRKGKKGWSNGQFFMSDEPYKFYDYNF